MKGHPLTIYCLLILLSISLTYHSFAKDLAKIFPLKCNFSSKALEPSGIVKYKNRLLFVSDNKEDGAIFELKPDKDVYNTQIFIKLHNNDFKRIDKSFKLDLEGIVEVDNSFYCIDERDRFIYRVKIDGSFEQIIHDIGKYNRDNNISFSNEANAGFEGIAFDPHSEIFFIANERNDAVVYLLKFRDRILNTIDHFSMCTLFSNSEFDISDIYFYNGFLYLIHRKGRNIIKINPYKKTINKSFDYSHITKDLYSSNKGHGFVEGLFINSEKIFLLLDSGGKKIIGKDFGEHGVLIILKRPEDF